MKANRSIPPDEETKIKIVERWRTSKLNSIPDIAAEFGFSKHAINTVINNYLSSKISNTKK